MPKYRVKHFQAVVEETTFDVETDTVDDVVRQLAELMGAAVSNGTGCIEVTETVASIDAQLLIYDEHDTLVYSGTVADADNEESEGDDDGDSAGHR